MRPDRDPLGGPAIDSNGINNSIAAKITIDRDLHLVFIAKLPVDPNLNKTVKALKRK